MFWTPLQSLAGFCLIKHITCNTFLQQTSYLYCSCQLVLGVTSTWTLTNRRWISEQACLDWASPAILYWLSFSGDFIIAPPMDTESLIDLITLISTSFLSQTFPCWALLASEWQGNEFLSLQSLWWGVVTPTHYTWAFIQCLSVPKDFCLLCGCLDLLGGRKILSYKTKRCRNPTILPECAVKYLNLKIHLVSWG